MKQSTLFFRTTILSLLLLFVCSYSFSDTAIDYIHAEWNEWGHQTIITPDPTPWPYDDETPFAAFLPDGIVLSGEDKLVYFTTKLDPVSGDPETTVFSEVYSSGDYSTFIVEMVFYYDRNIRYLGGRSAGFSLIAGVSDPSEFPDLDMNNYIENIEDNKYKLTMTGTITPQSNIADQNFKILDAVEMESVMLEIVNYSIGADTLTGDYEPDGDVDGSDLALFAQYYAENNTAADLNSDTYINGGDISEFNVNFGIPSE